MSEGSGCRQNPKNKFQNKLQKKTVTATYIVWFNMHELPKVLKITDWHYEIVEKCKQRVHNALTLRGSVMWPYTVEGWSKLVSGGVRKDTPA